MSGSYAQQCAQAADQAESDQQLPLTGSNLRISAIEVCTRAIQSWDGNAAGIAESFNNRGVLYFARQDYQRAVTDFQSAIAKNSALGQAYLNLGYALAALERWQQSAEALTKGTGLIGGEQARAYFTRGIANEELGNVRQAYEDYLKASELDEEWAEPREELARFSVRQD